MSLDHFMQHLVTAGRDARATFDEFVAYAKTDPQILGLVLSGSQAREGMATAHSDYDVYVVLRDDAPDALLSLGDFRSPNLDLAVIKLEGFRSYGLPADATFWEAYAFAGAQIVYDAVDGLIGDLVARKTRLDESEAYQRVADYLDAYANSMYRALKNLRDGRRTAALMDAAESVPCLLTVVFALHRRIRPYNKYLEWELGQRPLPGACWAADVLLPQLERIRADADPATQRALFIEVESAARAQGHGPMLDGWGEELHFLRGESR
ncbi:MAG TPA: hypothetical protein VH372_10715 [Actinospica sp.]|jgi:hypothetical protein|nr:hypothetical protein [Actinospica sp.]